MKHVIAAFLLAASSTLLAQEDSIVIDDHPTIKRVLEDTTVKEPSGLLSFNISQTALSDWQGGGDDNFSIISLFKWDPVLKKDRYEWANKVESQYGLIKQGSSQLYKKNIDRLFLLTKLTLESSNKYIFYSAQSDFRTQFAPGYEYRGDTIDGRAHSDFMSPAYIQLALGIDVKPAEYFSITFAPAAGKVTLVNRQYLADEGAFGVTPAEFDTAGNVITPGKRARFEFGGRVLVKFKKDLLRNVSLDSYVDLFSNYANNPQNIDVVVNNTLLFKITRYFTASIISQLVYDDDIISRRDFDKDGFYTHPNDVNGPRLQALTTFAFGFGYRF